jgi:hypothetical protein
MRHVSLIALALLAGCNSGPPVPTGAENEQLDDAARRLDRAEDNLSNVDEGQLPQAERDAGRQ